MKNLSDRKDISIKEIRDILEDVLKAATSVSLATEVRDYTDKTCLPSFIRAIIFGSPHKRTWFV